MIIAEPRPQQTPERSLFCQCVMYMFVAYVFMWVFGHVCVCVHMCVHMCVLGTCILVGMWIYVEVRV